MPSTAPAPPSLPANVETAIRGKYEVLGVLGEGGTGIVYDAKRVADGQPVALKVMHAHLAGEKQIVGRFQREAAILKRLEGSHICPILELGEAGQDDDGKKVLYIALPKLEGPTLEEILAKEGPIEVDRALDIVLEVLAALRIAHGHGVIHRDLKPANVILEGGKRVVVVDFGMSKIITGTGTGTTNLTAHNMVFGTPEYMSPEQARGDDLDARCDVYAAGVMLYELLTGKPPFTGPTPLGVLTEHLTGTIAPPSSRAPAGRVTKALESVVMHALARDRDHRYPSASALSAAIMHARARPDDVVSLRPEAFATNPAGTDAFAATMPAIGPPSAASSSPRAIVNAEDDVTGETLPAVAGASVKPAPKSSGPPPATKRSPPSPVASPVRRPPTVDSVRPSEETTSKGWIAVWVIAALLSVAIGVWFALRK
ncbi:MAG: protein kinase [Deltaproteobacteria bacterium]|nr:protein kinase [Deltaproteobacteria bacterium]